MATNLTLGLANAAFATNRPILPKPPHDRDHQLVCCSSHCFLQLCDGREHTLSCGDGWVSECGTRVTDQRFDLWVYHTKGSEWESVECVVSSHWRWFRSHSFFARPWRLCESWRERGHKVRQWSLCNGTEAIDFECDFWTFGDKVCLKFGGSIWRATIKWRIFLFSRLSSWFQLQCTSFLTLLLLDDLNLFKLLSV